jgi:hypothetical protein
VEPNNTIVELDAEGDGVADFQILLRGVYDLEQSDFILPLTLILIE